MQESPSVEFVFHHGRISLSLAGTLGQRTSPRPLERLPTPAALGAWLAAAGLSDGRKAPFIDPATYRRTIELREAIWNVADALVRVRKPKRRDVETINAAVKRWTPAPQLDPASLRLLAREGADPAKTALGRVAADALDLFANPVLRARLHACEAADCSAIFLDPGRGRVRRWCSMARCGNRAKVAAFRARQKES